MKKFIIFIFIFLLSTFPAEAKHIYPEKIYQNYFCNKIGGGTEFTLLDKSGRIDCITKTEVIEVEFASKWAESIGQSLYYSIKTGLKPAVLLIIENNFDTRYLKKLNAVAEKYGISVYTIRPEEIK